MLLVYTSAMSNIDKSFIGRTAVVTGATRGIGRAIAVELAKRGANVAFVYAKSVEEAEKVDVQLRELGASVLSKQCDVAKTDEVAEMIKETKKKFGRIDYLVNNAAITRDKLILRMSEQDWDEVINVNLKGAWNFARAALREGIGQNKHEHSSILNISSITGLSGLEGQTNYAASKAGMVGLTKSLAKEMARRHVTVNALALGIVYTDMSNTIREEYRERMRQNTPLGRFAEPQEIARIACFFLSEDAKFITGQVIQVDGGLAM